MKYEKFLIYKQNKILLNLQKKILMSINKILKFKNKNFQLNKLNPYMIIIFYFLILNLLYIIEKL